MKQRKGLIEANSHIPLNHPSRGTFYHYPLKRSQGGMRILDENDQLCSLRSITLVFLRALFGSHERFLPGTLICYSTFY